MRLSTFPFEKYSVAGLDDLIFDSKLNVGKEERLFWKEFILFGLAEFSVLSKKVLASGTQFSDLVSSIFGFEDFDLEEDS